MTIESDAAAGGTALRGRRTRRGWWSTSTASSSSPALRELVGKVRADDPFIAGVRVGQNQPRVVRLVIDLKQPVAPQVFTLAPVAAYRHRLVFDLYPTAGARPAAGADPREGARRAAGRAQAVQDALGRADRPRRQAAATPAPPVPRRRAPAADRRRRSRRRARRRRPSRASRRSGAAAAHRSPDHRRASTPATAARTRAPSAPAACARRTWCSPSRCSCASASTPMPGMRAMLTRDADFFVPLHERVRKARRVQADLFVSIHADAFFTPQARGAVGVRAVSQGGASSAAARWMAERRTRPTWSAASTCSGQGRAGAARPARHEHHRADQGQPEARQRGAGAHRPGRPAAQGPASSRPASRC